MHQISNDLTDLLLYKLDKVVCLKHIGAEEGVSLLYCSRSKEARRASARKNKSKELEGNVHLIYLNSYAKQIA